MTKSVRVKGEMDPRGHMGEPTVEELRTILEEHAKWLRGAGGARANLTDADLTGADLTGANLMGTCLQQVLSAYAWCRQYGCLLRIIDFRTLVLGSRTIRQCYQKGPAYEVGGGQCPTPTGTTTTGPAAVEV